jgi:hypothetical protein
MEVTKWLKPSISVSRIGDSASVPQGVVSDDQPDAREGQVGRLGVAERFAVPLKPGNAGGGKGPQSKTGANFGVGDDGGERLVHFGLRAQPHDAVSAFSGRVN